jgi:FixJ family two-component response regulator
MSVSSLPPDQLDSPGADVGEESALEPPKDTRHVVVVEDSAHMREHIVRLLEQEEIETVACASEAEFRERYDPHGTGCLLLDVRIPGRSGMDLLKELVKDEPRHPIILMTGHARVEMAVAALRMGAFDFISKPFIGPELVDCVQRALAVDLGRRELVRERDEARERLGRLTDREQVVVGLVVSGMTNKAIADKLGVSPQAVDARRANAMDKLGVAGVAGLVYYMLRARILSTSGLSGCCGERVLRAIDT